MGKQGSCKARDSGKEGSGEAGKWVSGQVGKQGSIRKK